VVVAVCGEQRHPALAEALTLLATRLAEKVQHTAEKLRDKARVVTSFVLCNMISRANTYEMHFEVASILCNLGIIGKRAAIVSLCSWKYWILEV